MVLLLLAVVFVSPWSRASALTLATHDAGHGKLVHLKFDRGYVEVFGFELVNIKKTIEIVSSDEWRPIMLNLCKAESEAECSHIQVSNSQTRPENMRQGTRMSRQHFQAVFPSVLRQVHVDIFHAATEFGRWENDVYNSGPVARLEILRSSGETRLLSSTLMTFLASGNTVLALTKADGSSAAEVAELRRDIEKALLEHNGKRPLLYFFGILSHVPEFKQTSLFPKECVVVGADYWSSDSQIIHATPDAPDESEQRKSLHHVPIMTTECHAEDTSVRRQHMTNESTNVHAAPVKDYIFVYGTRNEIGNDLLARLHLELMLPVVVLPRHGQCSEDLAQIGVTCIEQTMGVVQFHQLLRGARLVISECLNDDNPTLLETLRCGTPVLVHAGRHQFLDRYGERPHVVTWDNTSELLHAAHETVLATSRGDHKLPAWTPTPLRDDVMRDGVGNMLRMRRHDCDSAL